MLAAITGIVKDIPSDMNHPSLRASKHRATISPCSSDGHRGASGDSVPGVPQECPSSELVCYDPPSCEEPGPLGPGSSLFGT
jgi:hypothetical protein